jgi:hypothetical protein
VIHRVSTNVSEEHVASVFRVVEGTSLLLVLSCLCETVCRSEPCTFKSVGLRERSVLQEEQTNCSLICSGSLHCVSISLGRLQLCGLHRSDQAQDVCLALPCLALVNPLKHSGHWSLYVPPVSALSTAMHIDCCENHEITKPSRWDIYRQNGGSQLLSPMRFSWFSSAPYTFHFVMHESLLYCNAVTIKP